MEKYEKSMSLLEHFDNIRTLSVQINVQFFILTMWGAEIGNF